MLWRLLIHWFRSQRGPRLTINDVSRVSMKVRVTDLDVLRHMNNGVYLSIMDLGRIDLMRRCGLWQVMSAEGIYPVVANQTISYRKSLNPGQRYVLETAIIGYDAKAAFIEQRFVVHGEIFAKAVVRGRFLRKTGGVVSIDELAEVLGVDLAKRTPPEWVVRWAEDAALPPTKAPAPSTWVAP